MIFATAEKKIAMNRAQRRARHKPDNRMRINPAAALNPIIMSTPLTPGETVTMKLKLRQAFESIRTGIGDKDDFDHMVISYNAWMVLAESVDDGLCRQMLPAGVAMMRAKERVLTGKSLLWDGESIEPLQQFMDIYDAIIDSHSPKQIQDAILEAHIRQTGTKLNWKYA